MGQRSQRHLREFDGVDSSGRPGPAPVVNNQPQVVVTTAAGDTVTPAVVTLSGDFTNPVGMSFRITPDVDAPIWASFVSTAVTPALVAIEYAAAIDATLPFVTASASGDTVELLATGTSAALTLAQAVAASPYTAPAVAFSGADPATNAAPAILTFTGDFNIIEYLIVEATGDVAGAISEGTVVPGQEAVTSPRPFMTAAQFIDAWIATWGPDAAANEWYLERVNNEMRIYPAQTNTELDMTNVDFFGATIYP